MKYLPVARSKSKTGDWYFVLGKIPLTNYEQASFQEKWKLRLFSRGFALFTRQRKLRMSHS